MNPIIYVEAQDKQAASNFSAGFTIEEIKKRIYVNALGCELITKYLAHEGVDVLNIYNLHDIHSIRENLDTADIMLPNIHMDVRVIYDDNLIFIPKDHFKYDILPDIYVVLKLSDNHADFLGFFEPKLINRNNRNNDYYFIEKEKLSSPTDFKKYVEGFNGNTTQALTDGESDTIQRLAIALNDHDITEDDKKVLFKLMLKSAYWRERLRDFDKFEWFSYHVSINEESSEIMEDLTEEIPFQAPEDEFEIFETTDELNDFESDPQEESSEEELTEEDLIEEENSEEPEIVEEEIEEDLSEAPEEDLADVSEEELTDAPEEDLADTTEEDLVDVSEGEEIIEETSEPDYQVEEDAEGTIDLEDIQTDLEYEEDNLGEILDQENGEEVLENDLEEISDIDIDDIVPEEATATEEAVSDTIGFTEELSNFTEGEEYIEEIEPVGEEQLESFEEQVPDEGNDFVEEEQDFVVDQPVTFEDLEEMETSGEEEVSENENDSEYVFDNAEPDAPMAFEELIKLSESEDYGEVTQIETPEEQVVDENSVEEQQELFDTTYESNVVISSEDQVVGEIPIDVDNEAEDTMNLDELGALYTPNSATLSEAAENELQQASPKTSKKAAIFATTMIGILAAAMIFAAVYKNGDVVSDVAPQPLEPPIANNNVEPDDVLPLPQTSQLEEALKEAETLRTDNKPVVAQKQASGTQFLEVKKLSWEVPDYVSYNDSFKKYLQTAGKSLKLSLSSDLLLATEYAYSNTIKVSVVVSKDGSVKSVNISQSSGSNQIDEIVLRTVKETLNVVKAPSGVIVMDNIHMILKIYL